MKKVTLIIFSLFLIASCTNKRKMLNGHWHQFDSNKNEFFNCYIITDSTFSTDKETIGWTEPIKANTLKETIMTANSIGLILSKVDSLTKFRIIKDEVIINDSIVWEKQKDNLHTYISDFSAGLSVKINPIKTTDTLFDYTINKILQPQPQIYIGKKKNSNKYYIQLNDKVASIEHVKNFVFCHHCNQIKQKILIYADKGTPKTLLDSVEYEIRNVNMNQIYYLTINPVKRLSGFNRRK